VAAALCDRTSATARNVKGFDGGCWRVRQQTHMSVHTEVDVAAARVAVRTRVCWRRMDQLQQSCWPHCLPVTLSVWCGIPQRHLVVPMFSHGSYDIVQCSALLSVCPSLTAVLFARSFIFHLTDIMVMLLERSARLARGHEMTWNREEPGASPRAGLGWTCPLHFCQGAFLRWM